MSRDKKDYISRTFKISPELVKWLDAYSDKTGVSRTFVIEAALSEYLAKVATKSKPAE